VSGSGEIAAVDAEGEAVGRACIDAGGMQREDVGASSDGEVGEAGLRRIVDADGDDGEGVRGWSGGGSGVGAVGVDCASRAWH